MLVLHLALSQKASVLGHGRFMLKRTKPDNSSTSSTRLSEEVLADDRDDYEYLMQTSTVRCVHAHTQTAHTHTHVRH